MFRKESFPGKPRLERADSGSPQRNDRGKPRDDVSSASRIRRAGAFVLLACLLAALVVWNIASGTLDLSAGAALRLLAAPPDNSTAWHVVHDLRAPRAATAVILGGALSVSGFMLQTFFSNPIAGPFVLGISSGAKLAVALWMIVLLNQGLISGSGAMIAAAFVGAMACMGFILLISRKVRRMSMLVVCGVMIGYICSAITDFVVAFAEDSNIVNLHNWSMGSFSGIYWDSVRVMILVCGAAMIWAFLLSKPIGAYQLGEAHARSVGVNVRSFRAQLILLSSLLSACVTAFAGPISFVGIAVPFLIKRLFRTSKPLVILPGCFLGGAVFCLASDLLARTAFAPREISISSVTAVLGAPVVIGMMVSREGSRHA